jgi:hypothetical protein
MGIRIGGGVGAYNTIRMAFLSTTTTVAAAKIFSKAAAAALFLPIFGFAASVVLMISAVWNQAELADAWKPGLTVVVFPLLASNRITLACALLQESPPSVGA